MRHSLGQRHQDLWRMADWFKRLREINAFAHIAERLTQLVADGRAVVDRSKV